MRLEKESGGLQIPEHWKFPFKDESRTKIIQIVPEKGFLAVEEGKFVNAEYFFNNKGEYVIARRHEKLLHPSGNFLSQTTILLEGDIKQFFNGRDTLLGPNANILLAFSNQLEKKPLKNSLVEFRFEFSRLDNVRFPGLFMANRNDEIKHPYFHIGLKDKNVSGKNTDDWRFAAEFSQEDLFFGGSVIFGRKLTEALIKKGNDNLFRCIWSVIDEKLVIEQEDLKEGIVKIAKAPLKINQQEINRITFSEPPYSIVKEENGSDKLDVLWTNIGEVIGANLTYRYPLSLH